MAPVPARARATSVLVVDDCRDVADSTALLLSLHGCEVKTCADGPAALRSAADRRPDVVVFELRLPDMDGWEMARRLRSAGRHQLLVAVTASGREEDRQRSAAAGIDVHLVKPADPRLVADLVAAASN